MVRMQLSLDYSILLNEQSLLIKNYPSKLTVESIELSSNLFSTLANYQLLITFHPSQTQYKFNVSTNVSNIIRFNFPPLHIDDPVLAYLSMQLYKSNSESPIFNINISLYVLIKHKTVNIKYNKDSISIKTKLSLDDILDTEVRMGIYSEPISKASNNHR